MGKYIPKILLSAANVPADNYINAVRKAGGEAVAGHLPCYDDAFDGLILCGGGDVHPGYYGESINGSTGIDEERDEVEFALIKAFSEAGKPILGICRGCQILNVYFGGSLYQHFENADVHSSFSDYDLTHPIRALKGSMAEGLCLVNSYHHQAVQRIGADLAATAFYGDVIEAVEHKYLPVFGVQFHPERMGDEGLKIFRRFIDLCNVKGASL